LWIFFDIGLFAKSFELSLPRNARKHTNKKRQEKKNRMVGGWVWDLANARGGPLIFFDGPSCLSLSLCLCVEIFWGFFWKCFSGIFELLRQKNGQKRDKNAKGQMTGKQTIPLNLFVKGF
jgi:hypothetical protein